MDPLNSTYLGSGTNASIIHNKTLQDAGLTSLFFSDPKLCEFGICPGNSFLMGAAVDQDNPPAIVQPATPSISFSGGMINVSFGPTFTGHTYKIDSTTDFQTWTIDNTYIAGTGSTITRSYPIDGPMRFYRVITDGLYPY